MIIICLASNMGGVSYILPRAGEQLRVGCVSLGGNLDQNQRLEAAGRRSGRSRGGHTDAEAPGGGQLAQMLTSNASLSRRAIRRSWEQGKHTVVTAICRVVERIPICTVISAWRGGSLAHLLLAVGLEVCWVHGDVDVVAQR